MTEPITVITGTLGALKAAADAVKALSEAVRGTKYAAQVAQLSASLMIARQSGLDLQEAYSALTHRVRELEAELRQKVSWEQESADYEMTRTASGTTVYAYKGDADPPKPPHCICPRCYEDAQKSILQPTDHLSVRRFRLFACPRCNAEFSIGNMSPDLGIA